MSRKNLSASVLSALLTSASLAGCVVGRGGSAKETGEKKVVVEESAVLPTPTPTMPVKIALMFDKTGSTNYTRTPQIMPEELAPLINLIRDKGGELGVGLISDDSNKSLLRLRVTARPVKPELILREPKVGEVDTHELAEVKRRNAALKASFDKESERIDEVNRNWEGDTGRKVEVFSEGLRKLLKTAPAFPASDVWGAIGRAELFLAEDESAWPRPARRYLLLVSDAQHNVSGKPAAALRSGARLILVNGSASVGSLDGFKPEMFESASAAFQHIVSVAGAQE